MFKTWKKKTHPTDTVVSAHITITSMSNVSMRENKSNANKEHSYEEGQKDRSDSDDLFDTGHVTMDENSNSDGEDLFQSDHVPATKGKDMDGIDSHVVDTARNSQPISNEKDDSDTEDMFETGKMTNNSNAATDTKDAETNIKSVDDINGHLVDTPMDDADNVLKDTPHI